MVFRRQEECRTSLTLPEEYQRRLEYLRLRNADLIYVILRRFQSILFLIYRVVRPKDEVVI